MKIRFLILIELIYSKELEDIRSSVQTRAEFLFVYIAEVKADPLLTIESAAAGCPRMYIHTYEGHPDTPK